MKTSFHSPRTAAVGLTLVASCSAQTGSSNDNATTAGRTSLDGGTIAAFSGSSNDERRAPRGADTIPGVSFEPEEIHDDVQPPHVGAEVQGRRFGSWKSPFTRCATLPRSHAP
jgi:hypothetical protein